MENLMIVIKWFLLSFAWNVHQFIFFTRLTKIYSHFSVIIRIKWISHIDSEENHVRIPIGKVFSMMEFHRLYWLWYCDEDRAKAHHFRWNRSFPRTRLKDTAARKFDSLLNAKITHFIYIFILKRCAEWWNRAQANHQLQMCARFLGE